MSSLIGIPGALSRVLRSVVDRLGAGSVDRIWLFPPLVRDRRERGLVVAACYAAGEERSRVVTVAYTAGRTGVGGVSVETRYIEEGVVPRDRLDRVIAGVVSRTEIDVGGPRSVEIGGDARKLEDLIEEMEDLLEDDGPLP